ncbi:hypothetical protein [Streptomyces sp. P17]|uniref:hypothetical protein n=1 Tax=Streptomyces sp. P17 TaxID=3074716 RepID=UPI0028F427C5|nr:hypothetical protein [Streptomyces sp. P17]MDT9701702.1 hypothetical protein [Streptomyces sp. P17]
MPKTWSGTCIAIYLVGIGYMGIDTIPDEFGLWFGLSALFLLLLLPCLAIPISKFIYHRIQIDARTLRVGRERIPLADIDPASVQAASNDAPAVAQRYARSLATVDAPVPGLRAVDHGAPRLVGGGWGVPMGMDTVVIRTRQGERFSIATRDRTAFLAALLHVTTAQHQNS